MTEENQLKEVKNRSYSNRLEELMLNIKAEMLNYKSGSETWKQLYLANQALAYYDNPFLMDSPLDVLKADWFN